MTRPVPAQPHLWVLHALDRDTFIVEGGGEIALLDRETLIAQLTQHQPGDNNEHMGGDAVGGA